MLCLFGDKMVFYYVYDNFGEFLPSVHPPGKSPLFASNIFGDILIIKCIRNWNKIPLKLIVLSIIYVVGYNENFFCVLVLYTLNRYPGMRYSSTYASKARKQYGYRLDENNNKSVLVHLTQISYFLIFCLWSSSSK